MAEGQPIKALRREKMDPDPIIIIYGLVMSVLLLMA
jgi:hypothetical protein